MWFGNLDVPLFYERETAKRTTGAKKIKKKFPKILRSDNFRVPLFYHSQQKNIIHMKQQFQNSAENKFKDLILQAVEGGKIPWRRTWKSSFIPSYNFITGKKYSGINQMIGLLYHVGTGKAPVFATYKQIEASKDGHLPMGAKSPSFVIFSAMTEKEKKNEKTGDVEISKYFCARAFSVFHIDQCAGFEEQKTEVKKRLEEAEGSNIQNPEFTPNELAEKVISVVVEKFKADIRRFSNTNAVFTHGSEVYISLPLAENFEKEAFNYRTTFHEIGHFMEYISPKGISKDYAQAELFAEIFSQMMLDFCGIDDSEVLEISKSYIQGYYKQIEDTNSKTLYNIFTRAEKAFNSVVEGLATEKETVEVSVKAKA